MEDLREIENTLRCIEVQMTEIADQLHRIANALDYISNDGINRFEMALYRIVKEMAQHQ